MPAEIEYLIDASDVDAFLLRKLDQFPGARLAMLRRVAVFMAGAAKSLVRVNTGELRSKIRVVEGRLGQISVLSEAKYSAYVERGTRPHTPPFSPIERWARRKGLPAGTIWHAIRVKGTRAHPFMGPAARRTAEVQPRIGREELRRWAEG